MTDPTQKIVDPQLNDWYLIQLTRSGGDINDHDICEIITIRGKDKALSKAEKLFKTKPKFSDEEEEFDPAEDDRYFYQVQVYKITNGFKIDFENNSNQKPIFSRLRND